MKKHIYFLLQHLCVGGIEICVIDVANALARRGYEVTLLSVLSSNELTGRINPLVKVEYLTSLNKGANLPLFYKLKRKILSKKALYQRLKAIRNSIVVSTRNEYSIIVSKIVSSDCLKIAQLHHDYIERKGILDDFKYRYARIDYFFALTADVCSEVAEIMRENNTHTRCVTVPNFLPEKTWRMTEEKRENIALAVGRLATEKGFLRLLDIWKLVDERSGGKYQLFIAGEGVERDSIQSKIKDLGLKESVKLLGLLLPSEVETYMQKSKVYCMSSFTEAFSLVLLEAMSNGLPQVAFDVRVGPRNLILDGKTGYLVEDGGIEDYALKILTLLENESLWKQMSAASLHHFSNFSEEKIITKWELAFNQEL